MYYRQTLQKCCLLATLLVHSFNRKKFRDFDNFSVVCESLYPRNCYTLVIDEYILVIDESLFLQNISILGTRQIKSRFALFFHNCLFSSKIVLSLAKNIKGLGIDCVMGQETSAKCEFLPI